MVFVRKEKQLTKKTKSTKQLQQSRKKTFNARKKAIRLQQLRGLRRATSEQLPLILNTPSALKRLYLSASGKLSAEHKLSLLPILMTSPHDGTEPLPGLPTHLLLCIPALNFLLLFTFVRFASWPIVAGAIILLGTISEMFPSIYLKLGYTSWAIIALIIFRLALEAIYLFCWSCRYPKATWSEAFIKHDGLLFFGPVHRWSDNVPAAKRLASRRMFDVAFSALLLLSYFLFFN